MRQEIFKLLSSHRPLRVTMARSLLQKFPIVSYAVRLQLSAVDRPHYGHCIFEAAKLAHRLKYPKISVIEFGCGGGNGLVSAEQHIRQVQKLIPIEIELYGFDTGEGLPEPILDSRDYPFYFQKGLYVMDVENVRSRLEFGKLVLGNVRDTCKTFFDDYAPAPIGAVFHDLDYYSSTRDALTFFDADSRFFLPRIFMYFDDIIGNATWCANDYAGEMLAIREYNARQDSKKIAKILSFARDFPHESWRDQMYAHHDFAHPDYNTFVAGSEQVNHETTIRLRQTAVPKLAGGLVSAQIKEV